MRPLLAALIAMTVTLLAGGAGAEDAPPAALPAGVAAIRIAYLGQHIAQKLPSSFMDAPPQDDGIAGARLGVADDNTTGRFTAQNFTLDEQLIEGEGDVAAAFRKLVQAGDRLIVADLPAAALLAVADLPEAKAAMLLNVAAKDDALRGEFLPRQYPASHSEPGNARRCAGAVSRAEAVAERPSRARAERRRQGLCGRRRPLGQEIRREARGDQAVDLRSWRPAYRYRTLCDQRRGGALHARPVL